jgi:hypothetical protein
VGFLCVDFPFSIIGLDRTSNEHLPSWTAHLLSSASSAYKLLRGPPKDRFQSFIIVDSFDMLSYTTRNKDASTYS